MFMYLILFQKWGFVNYRLAYRLKINSSSLRRTLKVWTVPQLSIMIIYNCTLSILIQGLYCQLTIWPRNTKETILPVCDKAYHKIKENMPLGEELEILWNYPLPSCRYRVCFLLTDLYWLIQGKICTLK